MLSVEASKADASRHYGFYIDGDIAKLPGGMDALLLLSYQYLSEIITIDLFLIKAFFELSRERALALLRANPFETGTT